MSFRLEIAVVLLVCLAAGSNDNVFAAPQADWPHWRGPNRTDIVPYDSGFQRGAWRQLNLLWNTNVGEGSTSPIVAGGRTYTMGWRGNKDSVFCFDAASGKEIWRQSYPCPQYGRNAMGDQGLYSGPTSTPEFDAKTGFLFTLSTDGDLYCWDTNKSGGKVWHLNLYDKYGMTQRPRVGRSGRRDYGYTTAPLVYGETLIVEVGGKAGTIMGFDKRTGRRLWRSEATDFAGHTGGLASLTVDGVPCLAILTFSHLLVVRLDKGNEGKTVAHHPWLTTFGNNVAGPIVHEESVIITSGYNQNAFCRLKISLNGGAQLVWKRDGYASKTCTPVIHDGYVYWAWSNLQCLDLATGKLVWKGPRVGDAGSCIVTADEKLIVWSGRGDLFLVDTTRNAKGKYHELARFPNLARSDVWPHVVLAGDKLYCKDRRGLLRCIALDGSKPAIAARPVQPAPVRPAVAIAFPPEKKIDLKSWPGDDAALVLAWRRGLGLKVISGQPNRGQWQIAKRGDASFGSQGEMKLGRGAFTAEAAGAALLAGCKKSNELAIEAVFSATNTQQTGPARMISFSLDPYHRNFSLCQERSQLLLRLRTTQTGENGMRPQTILCEIQPNRIYHLIATYRQGLLACYLDGNLVAKSSSVRGDFSNWSAQHLLFGDEWQDSRPWSGQIERVAIFSRFIGPQEAARRFELSRPTD